MVWETDARGRNFYQSESWYAYTGSTREASSGESWLQFYHPEDREYLKTEWTRALATEGRHYYAIRVRIRRHDGSYRLFRVAGAPIRDDAGRVIRWIGTCTQERAA